MSFIKLVGRILIIIAIASSAYDHLEHPQRSLKEFRENYTVLDRLSNEYLKFDIPLENLNWKVVIKIFGLFELLVIVFILLGDGLGGFFYLLTIVGEIFFLLRAKNIVNIKNWKWQEIEQVAQYVSFLGIGLILACASCNKNK